MYPEVDLIGGNVVTVAQAQNFDRRRGGWVAGWDGLWIDLHHAGGLCCKQRICMHADFSFSV